MAGQDGLPRYMLIHEITSALQNLQSKERRRCNETFNKRYNSKYANNRGAPILGFHWEFLQRAPATGYEYGAQTVNVPGTVEIVCDLSGWDVSNLLNLSELLLLDRVKVKALCSQEALDGADKHGAFKDGKANHERRYLPYLVLKERLIAAIGKFTS